MSDNTTAIERLLEVSNQLWDAMYESGEIPTHAERSYYYLALKDAMKENAKLRELLADTLMQPRDYCKKYSIEYESWDSANAHLDVRMRELGVGVD